ncbi:SWIM zinc finger protein [Archangium gephyra]|uniref:SWIM zinc finger protein n=1 Tax=Archangium gephyra TaxID=48 RepID=A0AAC8QH90_9BACT|nr:SWIM zinc finger family protein [Archangium gephyra]AKJ07418.1 zinc finger, SWIM-type protein [Archangium gephyra]REG26814.1 SWIM zinc finger protein [Archangium gephyra]
MQFEYSYAGSTTVQNRGDSTALSFSPDVKRPPTFFSGELRQNVAFREAISALHDVVVSDLRFKPKDKTAYKLWAAQQEQVDLAAIAAQRQSVASRLKALREELAELEKESSRRMGPFYAARARYYSYLYEKNRDFWFVLDPVITVHPDECFFECFSQDESSYGRLGASYEVFQNVGEFACGTTNIDYSSPLYDEFQKIRSYKRTRFEVDPSGFTTQTGTDTAYKEVKIDLPDSWVRGFLQVNSAMALPAVRFTLHPMDVHNFLFILKRHKEKKGPRSMRYVLAPGQPVKVVFEPWGTEVVCRRSVYEGEGTHDIRVWGRRRLGVLERLIPVAKRFTVHLLGTGLPSFYVADLGDLSFTLGLSGWTANDWSTSGNFDLLAPRGQVDEFTRRRVFDALKETWSAKPEALASKLGLERGAVLGALSAWTQAGRAIWDLNKGVYRARELSREPLPMDKLRFSNEREERAMRFLDARAVDVKARPGADGSLELSGTVKEGAKVLRPSLRLDADQRMVFGECTCNFFQQNKLFRGPCEHLLALRLQHSRVSRT